MRKRFPGIVLAAGGRWPDSSGPGLNRPFNWVKVDNSLGSGSVDVGFGANLQAGDANLVVARVLAGSVRVFNVAGPNRPAADGSPDQDQWPRELFAQSAAGTTFSLEVADHPIVDLQLALATSSSPGLVRLEDGSTTALLAILQAGQGDGLSQSNALEAITHGYVWNGSNWDRERSASAAAVSAQSGVGAQMAAPPGNWSVPSTPAVSNAASASRAAGAAGVRHIGTNLAFGFSASTALASAQTVTVNLRDGATGAGTILKSWQFTLPAAVIAPAHFEFPGLSEVGSAATAMTLEFAAAITNLMTYANLGGYDAS